MSRARWFGDRFLRVNDLLDYARELRVISTPHKQSFLEWLDKQRLVVPIARLCMPAPLVRALAYESYSVPPSQQILPTETDSTVVAAAANFYRSIFDWPGDLSKPRWEHPLDSVPEECVGFVDLDPSTTPFKPWRERRVQLTESEEGPRYTSDYSDQFYRNWQVLQVAEALAIRVELYPNFRDDTLLLGLFEWKVDKIDGSQLLRSLPNSPGVFEELISLRREFEAVAFGNAYSQMAHTHRHLARELKKVDPATIDARFGDDCRRIAAREAVDRFGTSSARLMDLLRWQCGRWDHWKNDGRELLADEYARFISATVDSICSLTDQDFEAVSRELGTVTGHFKPTLKVVLPDWTEESREDLVAHFNGTAARLTAKCDPLGILSDSQAFEGFARWLEEQSLLQLFFNVEVLTKLNARSDSVSRVGYVKEAVAMATTLEHVVNAIVGLSTARGHSLQEKLTRLWRRRPDVVRILQQHVALTRTDKVPFKTQWAGIDALPLAGEAAALGKDLLRAVLIRNEGNHVGLSESSWQLARHAVDILIDAMLICWMESERSNVP